MGMRDESWCCQCGCSIPYTENESAMCGECATEIGQDYIENLIMFIQNKLNEHEQDLSDIFAKVDRQNGQFDNDDSSMQDYHEGAVEALSIVLDKAKDMYNA
jgi:arabinogalactan endo-1,4-beta-galactosidase